jgi:predicted nucleic acid-binding protein
MTWSPASSRPNGPHTCRWTSDILLLARDLIRRHALRGVDAIHLASALSLRESLTETVRFFAADERLLRAAEAERLAPVDVETGTD